jgi:hypothetical protein
VFGLCHGEGDYAGPGLVLILSVLKMRTNFLLAGGRTQEYLAENDVLQEDGLSRHVPADWQQLLVCGHCVQCEPQQVWS